MFWGMLNFLIQRSVRKVAKKGLDSQVLQVRKVLSQFDQRLILAFKAA